jgi:hypothetical protein
MNRTHSITERSVGQSYARVADRDTIESLIRLATDAATDPHAEVRAKLESAGVAVEFRGGLWIAETNDGSPRKIAARVATIVGDRCAVIVVGATKACAVLRADATLVMGERTPPMWHIMTMQSSVSTPMSLLTDADGLPSSRKRIPLGTTTPDLVTVAETLDVDLSRITEAIRRWS